MIIFSQLREDLEGDIVEVLKRVGVSELEINFDEGYVSGTFDTKDKVAKAVDLIPENVDYEIEVMVEVSDGDDVEVDSADDIGEIELESLDDDLHVYEIYVYLDNAVTTEAFGKDDKKKDDDDDDDDDDEVNEARKRVIKVNARGQRRIKIKCGKGFKFDGKKCIKIGGTERIKKRKAIKKSVRTKRAKGAGAARKATRLRLKAHKKRKAMGLNRR